jgi:hypothetical protein
MRRIIFDRFLLALLFAADEHATPSQRNAIVAICVSPEINNMTIWELGHEIAIEEANHFRPARRNNKVFLRRGVNRLNTAWKQMAIFPSRSHCSGSSQFCACGKRPIATRLLCQLLRFAGFAELFALGSVCPFCGRQGCPVGAAR